MLRVTTHDEQGSVTFQLEGKLAGPWVQVFEQCWHKTMASRGPSPVRVDLAGVTNVDMRGRDLLKTMYEHGAELITADCLMKAIVAEITRRAQFDNQKS